MQIAGIAPGISRLYDKNCRPSDELVYLAAQALERYRPSTLITSLYSGWDQALAKAALQLGIQLHVVLPYRERELSIQINTPDLYRHLRQNSQTVECLSDTYHASADMDCHLWRASRADLVIALWDYEFSGETFQVIDYALKNCKEVVNLWEDWSRLYSLRKNLDAIYRSKYASGAQIFPEKS